MIAVLLGLQISYGRNCLQAYEPTKDAPSIDVSMIQPMSPLKIANADKKTKARVAENLVRLSERAVSGSLEPPDLLIWPEGAAPFSYRTPKFNPEYCRELKRFQQDHPLPLVLQDIEFVNLPGSSKKGYHSTMTLVDSEGTVVGAYRKNRLMPFTEYLPGEAIFPSLKKVFHQTRSVIRGEEMTLLDGPQGPFVPLICYEVLLEDFARKFCNLGGRYIVHLTNDRWFAAQQQAEQHLSHAVFLAVENRVPVIRSTNSGISALIDARGVIRSDERTRVMEETVLRGLVHPRDGGSFYARFGDVLPRWVLTPGIILSFVWVHVRRFPFIR
jgi:apolipoprotein N-acyltransferase